VDIARRSRVAQRSLAAGEKAVATPLSVQLPRHIRLWHQRLAPAGASR
jgi:hypothetical protein